MNTKALFSVIFEDNSIYSGGKSYDQTLWKQIPQNKKIKRLFYTLPDNNHLCLEDYNKYFFMLEATKDLNGKNAGRVNIEYAYILGEKYDKVTCYKINLKERPDKNIGNIERLEFAKDSEFIRTLNKDGWR
jgi:hypothetical protein